MNKLITIATYTEQNTACFLKEVLENENIECHIAYGYNPVTHSDELHFQVKEKEVAHAISIMLKIRDKFGKPIDKLEPLTNPYKILVPTDFSSGSEYACQFAIHLAKKLKGEIKLLHVYENPLIDISIKESATFVEYSLHLQKEMERKAEKGMVGFVEEMRKYLAKNELEDIRMHSSVIMGNIIQSIRRVSEIYRPDLVVLGTVGREESPKSILAGVAEEIIKRLNIPIYAVPGPCSPSYFEKISILYATDFNEDDNTSLNQLLKIVQPLKVHITCIHIDTAHTPSSEQKMLELNEMLKKEYSRYDIECCLIEDPDIYHGISEFTEKNQINLLSMTTRKRNIFEKLFRPNLFKKILQESGLPMLIFPSFQETG